jgi:predicted membrane protein
MSREQHSKQSFGAILIIIGSVFLIDNLDLFPFDLTHYIFKWQVILIIIGSVLLVNKPEKNTGLILLSIGIFFLLPELQIFQNIEMRTWWPIVLIGIGVLLIITHQEYSRNKNNSKDKQEQGTRKIPQDKKELK